MRTLFALLCACSLYAEPGPIPHEVRFDQHGDPLPREALARLGTARWRASDWIEHVVVGPDEKTLVAVTQKGTDVLDMATGTRRMHVPFPGTFSHYIVFPADRRTAFGISEGKMLNRWDMTTGKQVTLANKGFARLAVSLDGQYLAAYDASKGNDVLLLDPATGQTRATVPFGRLSLCHLSFTADSKLLVAITYDGVLHYFDVATAKPKNAVSLNARFARQEDHQKFAFTATGDRLIYLANNTVCQLTVATGDVKKLLTLPDELYSFYTYAVAPDGKTLAVGTGKEIQLLGLPEGNVIKRWDCPFRTLVQDFAAGGKTLLTCHYHAIQRWDVATGKLLTPLAGHNSYVRLAQFLPDGQTLVTSPREDTVHVWDRTGQELAQRRFVDTYFKVATGSNALYVLSNGRHLLRLQPRTLVTEEATRLPTFVDYFDAVSGVPSLAYADSNMGVHVWDHVAKTTRPMQMPAGMRALASPRFAASGRVVVSHLTESVAAALGEARSLVLWSNATGRLWRELGSGASPSFPRYTLTPDGRMLLANAAHGQLRLWDMTTGELRQEWTTTCHSLTELHFLPNRHAFALCEDDRRLHFFRLGDSQPYATIHTGLLANSMQPRIAFAADGQTLATCQADTTVLLWRTPEPPAVAPTTRPFAELWADLAHKDTAVAFKAMLALESRPAFVGELAKHVQPVQVDAMAIAAHLKNLNHDRYAVREQAQQALLKIGPPAAPTVRAALRNKPTTDAKQRLETLLQSYTEQALELGGEDLRSVRVIEVLEHLATAEAKTLLATLATGAPEARVTQEANETLQRLKRR